MRCLGLPVVLRPWPCRLLLVLLCLCCSLPASCPTCLVHAELPSRALLSIGRPASSARFPGAAHAWRFCPDTELRPCVPPPPDAAVCLSAAELEAAFSRAPQVHASLYARYDLELVLESQADDSSEMLDHVLRVLLTEVGGYSVRHVWNPRFMDQIPRCLAGKFDFHSEIWKTDWSDSQWQTTFFGPAHEAKCELVGVNGLLGQNSWYADTRTVKSVAASAPPGVQSTALDFWRAYATEEGVENLPRFHPEAARNGSLGRGVWFVPPQCNVTGALCGVAYGMNIFFEPGVPQQQIVNLGLRLALLFPSTASGETDLGHFADLVNVRMDAGQQVLLMASNTMTFVATPDFTRVALPHTNKHCHIEGMRGSLLGEGGLDCDFRAQSLYKIVRHDIAANSDLRDGFDMFHAAQFDHDEMVDLLGHVRRGTSVPDAACEWVRNNTHVWAGWFHETTERKYTVMISDQSAITIYALLAFFFAISVAAHLFLWRYSEHVVIRRSNHRFSQCVVAGASCFYVALVIGIQPDSDASCLGAQFALSVAFSLFYGSLLVKTYRILLITSSTMLQSARLSDGLLALYLLAYAGLDLLLVTLWVLVDPPLPTLTPHSTKEYAFVQQCRGEHTDIFRAIIYLLRGVALMFGIFLSIRIRGVSDAFNESKALCVMSYNIGVVATIVVGIGLVGTNSPEVTAGTWMAGVAFAVFLSLLVFLTPKALTVLHGSAQGSKGPTTPIGVSPKQVVEESDDSVRTMRNTSQLPLGAPVGNGGVGIALHQRPQMSRMSDPGMHMGPACGVASNHTLKHAFSQDERLTMAYSASAPPSGLPSTLSALGRIGSGGRLLQMPPPPSQLHLPPAALVLPLPAHPLPPRGDPPAVRLHLGLPPDMAPISIDSAELADSALPAPPSLAPGPPAEAGLIPGVTPEAHAAEESK